MKKAVGQVSGQQAADASAAEALGLGADDVDQHQQS